MHFFSSFVLEFQKMFFVFTYGNQKCQKLHFKKVSLSFLHVFLPLHSQIKIYCFKIWYVCCFNVALQHIFWFLDNSKILVFINISFKNPNFEFWESKSKTPKIRDRQIIARSILRLFAFTDCVLLQTFTFQNHAKLQTFPAFDPKSRNVTSLKRHFL